jgi:glycosyltransferase involved in cell wall biosynthesis
MRGVPFVYDIQDLWPDTLPTSGMFNNRFGLKLIGAWCKFTYRFADKIVVLSPGLKKVLSKRGVPDEKIEVIYNWCDDRSLGDDELDPQLVKELGLSGNFNIVFAGNIGLGQALDSVIEAASMLKTDCPSAQIVIIGQGVELDRLKTKASNLDNVIFLPPKPFKEIGAYLRQADALLLHLKDDPLFEITIPSKLQAYLAIGRPIIVGVKGSAAKLVDEAGAGLSCVPQNPSSIAKTICDLNSLSESQRKLMGQRGREFYKRTMSLEVGTKRFEKLFRSVLDSNKN